MNNDRHEIRPFRLSQDYAYLLGSKRLFASACFYAIPAHFFRESDLEFETGVLSEDVEWFARLLVQVERIAIINGQPYSYRLRKGSISNSVSEKHVIDLKRHLSKIQELISTVEQSKQEYLETYLAEQIANYIIVISSRSDWQKYSLDLELRRAKLRKCLSRRSRIINTSCQIIGIKGTILLLRLVKRITKK